MTENVNDAGSFWTQEAETVIRFSSLPTEIGQRIEGEGIYLGRYHPPGVRGTFNVYAAPADLTDREQTTFTYIEALATLAKLRNWHGQDGEKYDDSSALYAALKNETYKGGWVIPPLELLNGHDIRDFPAYRDYICKHAEKGALSGTFKSYASHEALFQGRIFPDMYWSSAVFDSSALAVNISRLGSYDLHWKTVDQLSCRLVRFTPHHGPLR